MLDKAKTIKEAQKLLAKGLIDKAIAEWEKVAQAYPDGNTYNFIGDLFVKKGDKVAAAGAFHKAAKIYMDEGFSLKSLAIFKKILNVNPQNAPALIALGELNEEKNIQTDAIRYYLAAADVLSKENKKDELLKVYDKILNLAPNNIQLRVKVADMFAKEAFVFEASKEFFHIGQLFMKGGDLGNAKTYFLKAIEMQPGNKDTLMALSFLFEKQGDLRQAVAYINNAIERLGEAVDLLLRKSHLLASSGAFNDAAAAISKVIEIDPQNMLARKQMADLYAKAGNHEKAWAEYQLIIDKLVSENHQDEAIRILSTFKSYAPVENSRKLVELYRATGNDEAAVNELIALHETFKSEGNNQDAIKCLKDALDINPARDDIRDMVTQLEGIGTEVWQEEAGLSLGVGLGEAPSAEALEQAPEAAAMEAAPSAEGTGAIGEVKTLEEVLTETDIFLRYGLFSDARTLLEKYKDIFPESVDVYLKLKNIYTDIGEKDLAVDSCITLAALYDQQGDEAQSRAMLLTAYEMNPTDPRLAGRIAPQAVEAPTAEAGGEGDMAEADFYYQQGFYKEAEVIYRRLLAKCPDDEAIQEKLRRSELGLAAPVEAPAVAAEGEEEAVVPEFEAEGALASEPTLENDVLGIFDEFKKGIEKEIEAEDAETHYNLGIAYREMGLIDDSIKEFQTSQRDPGYLISSCTMLGACYMQKGLYQLAVEAFSTALIKTDPKDEASWSLKYDLAEAHEMNNDPRQALQLFTEVYGWNANFRHVAEKLDHVRKSEALLKAQPPKAAEPAAAQAPSKPAGRKDRVSYL